MQIQIRIILLAVLSSGLIDVKQPKPFGKFVLVTLEGATIDCCDEGDIYCPCESQQYIFTPADSVEQAAEIMTAKFNNGSWGSALVFVGVWPLPEDTRIDLKHKTIRHPKKVRYEDEGWTEHRFIP